MKVKPVEGRMVRDPRNMQLLPGEGRDVPDSPFWRRRVRDGDVTAEDAPEATEKTAGAASPRRAVPEQPAPDTAPSDAQRS